ADAVSRPKSLFKSTIFVVADIEAEFVVLIFVLFEEDIRVILAEFLVDFDVVGIWNFLVARFLGIRILEGDDFGRRGILDLFFDFLFVVRIRLAGRGGRGLAGQSLLEIGAGIALA